jgi:putative holliday junction resolvase
MILGIDFGTAKIGLAIVEGSATGALPLPLSIITYSNNSDLLKSLQKVIDEYSVDTLVIGILPSNKAGDEDKQKRYEAFTGLLKEHFSLPILYVDEQRSTKAAKNLGRENPDFKEKNDDALAAQVILETYLATHGPEH